ncbi:hypothetical protein Nmel_016526 [Mimus melanotis]
MQQPLECSWKWHKAFESRQRAILHNQVSAVPLPQALNRITEIHSGRHRAFTLNILVLRQNPDPGCGL